MGYTSYFVDYLKALDAKLILLDMKILFSMDQCAAHP
jgi:hypothetical protein